MTPATKKIVKLAKIFQFYMVKKGQQIRTGAPGIRAMPERNGGVP